ncbi:hypothetical protein GCM10023350_21840 [Nocardioides endophyticus]|uniref:CbtA family protein n=1 Tax=Nocardioides endophyticus TaxID=1353775 RepID=A0ABP8YVB2_9ACTN
MSVTTTSTPLGRTVSNGALAGLVAGGVGAAVQYWVVEPVIKKAIALEEAGAEAPAAHTHAGDVGAHSHGGDAIIGRSEQIVTGLVTVLVVGVLIGIAFALAHRYLHSRIPGRGTTGTVMFLTGVGFAAFTLAPAIVIPANPPAVGDPDTVDTRTLVYIATIVCAAALAAAVTAVARHRALSPEHRALAATAVGLLGATFGMWALPNATDAIPATVPADLIWQFRTRSLAQIGVMWLVLGSVLAFLSTPARSHATAPATAEPAHTPAGV